MATDPVCGMYVDEGTHLTALVRGRRYYFCSHTCMEAFTAPAKEIAQPDSRLLDAGCAGVLVGEDLLHASHAEVSPEWKQRAAVPEIAMNEHGRALLRAARSPSARREQADRVEKRGGSHRHELACDDAAGRLRRHREVVGRRPRASHQSGSCTIERS